MSIQFWLLKLEHEDIKPEWVFKFIREQIRELAIISLSLTKTKLVLLYDKVGLHTTSKYFIYAVLFYSIQSKIQNV